MFNNFFERIKIPLFDLTFPSYIYFTLLYSFKSLKIETKLEANSVRTHVGFPQNVHTFGAA